jgi:hypothetical protein
LLAYTNRGRQWGKIHAQGSLPTANFQLVVNFIQISTGMGLMCERRHVLPDFRKRAHLFRLQRSDGIAMSTSKKFDAQ